MTGEMIHSDIFNFFAQYMDSNLAAVLSIITSILLAIIVTFLAVKLSNLIFKKIIRSNEIHVRFLHSLFTIICILCGILLLAVLFGYSGSLGRVLLGSTGLLIAIVGFAAQAAIGDIIAGVMIGITRPFKLGDLISIEGTEIIGVVHDMTIRHTVLHCFDGLYEIVPNSVINGSVIHNGTYHKELTGAHLDFGISYGSDIRTAMKIIHDAVIGCRHTVEYAGDNPEGKRAAVYMTDFGSSAIMLRTTVWARNADELYIARSEIMMKVKEDFEANGVEIPFNFINVVDRGSVPIDEPPVKTDEFDVIYEDESTEILKSVKNFCRAYRVTDKDTARINLLTEELLEMMKDYRGSESYFTINMEEGNSCELHYKIRADVSDSHKKYLYALDRTSNNGILSGLVNKIIGDNSFVVKDDQWSLSQYREDIRSGEVEVEAIGTSIITSMADDIRINTKNGLAEIVICKKVETN